MEKITAKAAWFLAQVLAKEELKVPISLRWLSWRLNVAEALSDTDEANHEP